MTAIPYMAVKDARAAMAFYEDVFGVERFNVVRDGDKVVHARIRFDDESTVFLHEYTPGELSGVVAPDVAGSTSVTIRVALATRKRVDRIFQKAEISGALIMAAPKVESWGEYYGRLRDPFGHAWAFGAYDETGAD